LKFAPRRNRRHRFQDIIFVIFSVFYILVAAAMTVLILMQNGQGEAGFGGGGTLTEPSGKPSRGQCRFRFRRRRIRYRVWWAWLGNVHRPASTGATIQHYELNFKEVVRFMEQSTYGTW
jgi:hypothetical protein